MCVPHSEVIDGSIVERGVQSRSFYCVSESRGELEQEGGGGAEEGLMGLLRSVI